MEKIKFKCSGFKLDKFDRREDCFGVYECYLEEQALYCFLRDFKAYRSDKSGKLVTSMREVRMNTLIL